MESDRLVAFTDGVMAVAITIMVLELKAPEGGSLPELLRLWPVFASYVLSFVYVAIYWTNHHHFFKLTHRVDGAVLWANLHLLFWISLVPFSTAWVGEHPGMPIPTVAYGVVLLAAALAWWVMQLAIVHAQGSGSAIAHAIGRDVKGKLSPLLYGAGIALAFVQPVLSYILYAAVAAMWLIPDRRVTREVRGGR